MKTLKLILFISIILLVTGYKQVKEDRSGKWEHLQL